MNRIFYGVTIVYVIWFFCIGISWRIFSELPFSKVLIADHGQVIAAKVAFDGQWRFPVIRKLDSNYIKCLINYEDRRYFHHLGIDPFAMARAMKQNIQAGKIISGGSTITMQIARLALGNKPRSWLNKFYEILIALGLENVYTKNELLVWYAKLAPYGGNVVGLETAVWRYFPTEQSRELTLAQAALCAVLPNQPSYLHLAKNRTKLLNKRNALIQNLLIENKIDSTDADLAMIETLPDEPFVAPRIAPHALEFCIKKFPSRSIFYSSIDFALQSKCLEIANEHGSRFRQNEIHNLAVLIVENATGKVKSYIGNNPNQNLFIKAASVDNIHAPRSSGSVLKPILYAAMIDRAKIGPASILPDIPTLIAGFRPENFSLQYDGAVAADEVIQRSLNVPSVKMLHDFKVDSFLSLLKKLRFSSLFRAAEEYGLSLILGGAEVNLWDLIRCYSNLANCLASVYPSDRNLPELFMRDISLFAKDSLPKKYPNPLSPGALFHMTNTMQHTKGNDLEKDAYYLNNHKKIAWKTGTSFGYKDAWCIGYTQDYTVGVWIGNSNGLGRPGLIGLQTAAPLMFELFSLLPFAREWPAPYDYTTSVPLCKQSGYYFSPYCTDTLWTEMPNSDNMLSSCTFHQKIFTSADEKFRVYAHCSAELHEKHWFVLPPALEYFYALRHPQYKKMPVVAKTCHEKIDFQQHTISFIYPNSGSSLFIPIDLDLIQNECYFKAVHRTDGKPLHWFMDSKYLGTTYENPHHFKIPAAAGLHNFLVADDEGQTAICQVEFFGKRL